MLIQLTLICKTKWVQHTIFPTVSFFMLTFFFTTLLNLYIYRSFETCVHCKTEITYSQKKNIWIFFIEKCQIKSNCKVQVTLFSLLFHFFTFMSFFPLQSTSEVHLSHLFKKRTNCSTSTS